MPLMPLFFYPHNRRDERPTRVDTLGRRRAVVVIFFFFIRMDATPCLAV